MTTNQTIDGVRREILEKALRDAKIVRFQTDKHVTELRALLDAPAVEGEPVIHITPEVFAMLRGERKMQAGGITFSESKPLGNWTVPLYAEQPAPVSFEPVIHGRKLDEYDSVLDALDPESVCQYLSNGEASELVSAVRALQAGQITRAAPVAAQQPYAWFTEDHLTDKSATTYERTVMERWKAKGWPVSPMYLSPAAQAALLSKGFTTLETGDGKYRIVTQYKNRDDAWSDYTALCKADQPAPVAVVLPEPMKDPGPVAALTSRWAQGWNACIDEVTRLSTK